MRRTDRRIREATPRRAQFILEPSLATGVTELLPRADFPDDPRSVASLPVSPLEPQIPGRRISTAAVFALDEARPLLRVPLGFGKGVAAIEAHSLDGRPLRLGFDYDVIAATGGGALVRALNGVGALGFTIIEGPAPIPLPPLVSPPALQREVFKAIAEELRAAGMRALAEELERVLDVAEEFSTESLSAAIDRASVYSYRRNEGSPAGIPEGNLYRRHARALDGQGTLHMQCYRAAALFVDIIDHYRELTGEKVHARILHCDVAQAVGGRTIITNVGHAIAEVRIPSGMEVELLLLNNGASDSRG